MEFTRMCDCATVPWGFLIDLSKCEKGKYASEIELRDRQKNVHPDKYNANETIEKN